MKNKIKLSFIVALLFCNAAFAERYIQPTKYNDQEEVLVQGGTITISHKNNAVAMFQTSETLKGRRGNFHFVLTNNTDRPINFYFENLRVTDQWGRPVRVVPKQELISDRKSKRNWESFGSALITGMDTINAQSAGDVSYRSHTSGNSYSRINTHGSRGWSNTAIAGHSSSTTTGTMHVEAYRQQALRQAGQDAAIRDHAIDSKFEESKYRLNNFYFDSNTIFPGSEYAANFQIQVDKNVERDLQYLLFTYDMGGEKHTFCYYCGYEK